MESTQLASWNRVRSNEEIESFLSRREAIISSLSE